MCCDICPLYDECEELDELRDDCCTDCPDYEDCQHREDAEPDAAVEEPEENERVDFARS